MMKTHDPSSPSGSPPGGPQSPRTARLADWLWASGHDLRQRAPEPGRDDAVLQAMRASFATRQRSVRRVGWRWALAGPALCATVLVACVWLLGTAPPGESGATVARGSDFIVLVSADRWAAYEKAGAGTAWLVPTDVPRERLALLGLPYDPAAAAEPVHAELLVHASGDVLAMRVLP
ncbi:hypothetical protein CDN99_16965 [Roseateles aquatilis]|uniref:Uncharacterized protein n=1 Tax=Roseateles aquatilis TaxID=431061 RepID=A0A246J7D2_9BURK|nr:hypothetical protein [Roseateles aquatilis]OWQ88541.1 hypothetical protein CDN99_16965 [Roseateles aquatilis]